MRKLIAIFMLTVFAFNVAGYQLLYDYLSRQSDTKLEAILDQYNYNDRNLITITQPTNLPYYSNSNDFQRIDGEVDIDGVTYKYVKCRIYNGNLEMLCIPNISKMTIEQSENNYAKGAHGFQSDDAGKKDSNPVKSFQKSLSDFDEQPLFTFHCDSQQLINQYALIQSSITNQHCFTTVEQPPDALLV